MVRTGHCVEVGCTGVWLFLRFQLHYGYFPV
jgi:hypothetical protein